MKALRSRWLMSAAPVIPAVMVVIGLAVIQYRWSNQVSEATSVRLADSLHMSLINWHLDLFRTLSAICLRIRTTSDSSDPSDLSQYAKGFAEWKSLATYPDLVSQMYIVQLDEAEEGRVSQLDPVSERFGRVGWPLRLTPLYQALEQSFSSTVMNSTVANQFKSKSSQSDHLLDIVFREGEGVAGWLFEPEVPAIVHPLAGTSTDKHSSRREAARWLVVELNQHVISTKLFPELAQRYFSGTDGLDYQVAVVAGASPSRVMSSSDAGVGLRDIADADGWVDIFGRLQGPEGSPIHVFHTPSVNRGPAASIGMSWFTLLGNTPADQDWQLFVRHRRGGALGVFVAEMHRRDLAISFCALLLLTGSLVMLVIASSRAQRLATLQMEFVTAVSHELRTPLTIISSAADNIVTGVVEGKQQLIQYGSVIGAQARHLAGLVEQVLLFAATRERHDQYSLQPLEVADIIEATLASTAGLMEASQFTVEREVQPRLPRINGDSLALVHCLQNLVTNALKYGGEERWVGIRAWRSDERSPRGGEIQISVSDRGLGISPTDLPHIFEPFYRSPSVAAAKIRGTGLGLSLAKRVAEAMKGHLTVVSVPQQGSTFTLHLPVGAELAPENAAAHPGGSGTPGL
jgi:signal transduction histidine kinase